MLTGLPPWYTTDKSLLFERIRTAPIKFPALSHSLCCTLHACQSPSFVPFSSSSFPLSFIVSLISQLILNKDPACRLGSRSSDDIFNHPFFSSIDWTALNKRLISPPFDPCKNLTNDLDTTNFEKEFTKMPMYSMEEMEARTSPVRGMTVSPGNTNPYNNSPLMSSGPFSQFTFGEDSYLERIASR